MYVENSLNQEKVDFLRSNFWVFHSDGTRTLPDWYPHSPSSGTRIKSFFHRGGTSKKANGNGNGYVTTVTLFTGQPSLLARLSEPQGARIG